VARKQTSVKKYVVRLSAEKRGQLEETAVDEGPHPVEGRRIGGRRRLERQPHSRGTEYQRCEAVLTREHKGELRTTTGF
jgi:hypothetical protein